MPNLSRLAEAAVVFDSAYCNSPLCAPSRFTLVSGQLPSKIGAYDNAADFPADVPTYAHHLRRLGYRTALSGKMHFCGPDQLHGYEERLTSDIYPADYGWAVNWDEPDVRPSWYHNMSSVLQAGPCVRTNQLDFDEEVVFKARQYLYDHVREQAGRPFCLTVSMTHPHDPYTIPACTGTCTARTTSRCPRCNWPSTSRTRTRSACSRSSTCGTSRCPSPRSSMPAAPTSAPAATSTRGRRAARDAGGGHPGGVLRRSRRHAWRARPLVQDALVRDGRAGADAGACATAFRATPGEGLGVDHGPAADPGGAGRRHPGPAAATGWPLAVAAPGGRGRARRGVRRIHGRRHHQPADDDPSRPLEIHLLGAGPAAALQPGKRPRELENLAASASHREVLAAFLAEARARWDIPAIHGATSPASAAAASSPVPWSRAGSPAGTTSPGWTPASSTCATTSTSTIWSAAHVIHSHDQRGRTHGRPHLHPQGKA